MQTTTARLPDLDSPIIVMGTTHPNGMHPPAPGPLTQLAPLYIARDAHGTPRWEQIADGTFESALARAQTSAQASITEITLPEDHGFPAPIVRSSPLLGVMQAADGAWLVATLTARPAWTTRGVASPAASIDIERRRVDQPAWVRSTALVSMAGGAPTLAAVVGAGLTWDLRHGDAIAPTR